MKLATGMNQGYTDLKFNGQHFLFEASVDVIRWDPVEGAPGFASVQIPAYYPFGAEGSPSLPRLSTLFEAGPQSYAQIRMERMDSMVFDLGQLGLEERVVPFSPSVSKGDQAATVMADSTLYSQDRWIGEPVIGVEYEGRMRGLSMSNLHFNPVQYNPVRNQLKVYYNISCFIETTPAFALSEDPPQAFSALFDRVVRQSGPSPKKAVQAEQPMTLVILTDPMFRETLQPLVQWKTRKGFRVVEAYRYDSLVGGSRESMKAYLNGLYENPPDGMASPSFLLIVGDWEQIPLSQSTGQITDLYYAEYDGEGDYIPDLFYGRISVNTPAQLQGVLDKILEYEQYLFPDPSFLDRAVLIAGVDGSFASSYGNGQINYAHDYYLNAGFGNQTHMFPYPESDTSDQAILQLISDGVGFVNYTGHGLADRWENPTFRTSDIENLQNLGKYPVIIGNGCETNVFTHPECFAEALLRAPGKGALAYIGCTNDSYWDEDYYWAVGVGAISAHPDYLGTSPGTFDKVFHTHGEARELWTPTLGEMIFGGNMAVQQSSSFRKKFYWEIYQLAGDPTLVPWFIRPGEQEVICPEFLPGGVRRVDVSCAPYSYLALSQNGILLDAKHASAGGYATLRIPDTIIAGKLDLIISGDRFKPFMQEVEMGVPSGIYLDLLGHSLSGETSVSDQLITPGEEATLDLHLINRGDEPISDDTLLLFSGHGSIKILDSLSILERLEPGDTLLHRDAFRFRSANHLVDQERVVLGIRLKGSCSPQFIKETLHAPVLVSGGISWDDRPLGNGNGTIEQEEWLLCNWSLFNSGHFGTGTLQGKILSEDHPVLEQVIFENRPVLDPGDTASLTFAVKVGSPGKGWHGSGSLSAGDSFTSVVDSFVLTTGRYFEDFSLGRIDRFPFVNSSLIPWSPDEATYSSAGHSLRSGKISHNMHSELSIRFEATENDTLSFLYRVSSESYYDFLKFYVDSTLAGSWSGETGWNSHSQFMEAGPHEVTWSYTKDGNTSMREDAAWIDDIIFPESAFMQGDLSLMEIIGPHSGPWLSSQEQVVIRVRNSSGEPIDRFTAGFWLNGIQYAEETYTGQVLPGEDVEFSPDHLLDLSRIGTHSLRVNILSDTLGYLGNNWLEKKVLRYGYPDLSLSLEEVDHQEGAYADALITVENAGNIPADSLRYEIWMDNLLSGSGTRFIGLEPGERTGETFRLADSLDNLVAGPHDYLVRAVDPDSVMTNNEVAGTLTWHTTGMFSPDDPAGWLVYPNPARSAFTLVLREPARHEILFDLVSLSGRVVKSFTLPEGKAQLRILTGSAEPGTYLLRRVDTGHAIQLVFTR